LDLRVINRGMHRFRNQEFRFGVDFPRATATLAADYLQQVSMISALHRFYVMLLFSWWSHSDLYTEYINPLFKWLSIGFR